MQLRFKSKPRPPDQVDGVKVLYPKVRSKGHKIAWYLILFAVLSPIFILSAGVVGSWLTLTANGTVFLEQYEIRAPQSGRINRLGVAPGEAVSAGKTVAVINSLELEAAAARNAVERQSAAAALRQRQTVSEELLLRERVLRYQKERRDAISGLVQEGAATVAELSAAESAAAEAEVGWLQTRGAADRAAGGSTAELEHDLIEREQRSMTLTSPYNGRILELAAKPGQYVTPGEPVVILARTDNPRVVAYTSPRFGTRLKVGMQATIRFPDGTRTLASVAEPPRLTQRMPADLVDQFGLRPMTVVLNLLPADRLSENHKVHGLPVSVRFHYDWESSGIGKAVGELLGDLSR